MVVNKKFIIFGVLTGICIAMNPDFDFISVLSLTICICIGNFLYDWIEKKY